MLLKDKKLYSIRCKISVNMICQKMTYLWEQYPLNSVTTELVLTRLDFFLRLVVTIHLSSPPIVMHPIYLTLSV